MVQAFSLFVLILTQGLALGRRIHARSIIDLKRDSTSEPQQNGTSFLTCELCYKPDTPLCQYAKWRTTLHTVTNPWIALKHVGSSLHEHGWNQGWSNIIFFCEWMCVPTGDSENTCTAISLNEDLLAAAEVLQVDGNATREGTGPKKSLTSSSQKASNGSDATEEAHEPVLDVPLPEVQPGVVVVVTEPTDNDSTDADQQKKVWVVQSRLPREGWLVHEANGEGEKVVPFDAVEAIPRDDIRAQEVEHEAKNVLAKCKSECAEHTQGTADRDRCCWTYAGIQRTAHGTYMSAHCVSICSNHRPS